MSFNSDLMEERFASDAALEQRADDALLENRDLVIESDGGARKALGTIFEWMNLDVEAFVAADDVDSLLEGVLSPRGIMYEEVDPKGLDLAGLSEFVLAQRDDGTYVACRPALIGYACLDPETGVTTRIQEGAELGSRAWLVFKPLPEGIEGPVGYLRMVLSLIGVRDVVPIVLASVLVYALGLIAPQLNRWVLDRIVPEGLGAVHMLAFALAIFLTAGFARAAIQAAKTLFLGHMRLRVSGQAEAAVMARALLLPQSFFDATSSGKVSKRLAAARQIADRMLNLVLNLGLTAVFSLGYIPQMLAFGPQLVIPAVVTLAVRSALTLIASIANVYNEEGALEAELASSGFMFSALRGASKIRSMGAERRVYARWAAIYQRVLKFEFDQVPVLKLEGELASFVASAGTLLLVSIVVGSDMQRSDYIAFNASYALIVSAVGELLDAVRSIMLMSPLMGHLEDIISEPVEGNADQLAVTSLRGGIELDHVSFSYPGGLGSIDDFCLKIRPGEKVAFVGESGCGKSTLMKLILGIEKPKSGAIFFDGRDLSMLDLRSLRSRIGSVFQFSRLIPGTVRSNICFTTRAVSEEEVWQAAEKAAIADDLRALPLGIDTEISESNSSGFSGGQRQRILIARAFASKPAIMVLDEATSALDNITQKRVLDAVFKERCTVLMVAHRLSTVMDCDRILVMEGGAIVEEGSYEELLAAGGLFSRLVRKQVL